MTFDKLNIRESKVLDFYHKLREKVRVGVDNFNRVRKEYPIGSVSGTLTTGLLTFSYCLSSEKFNTVTDLALMSAFMIPLFVGCYLDKEYYERKSPEQKST